MIVSHFSRCEAGPRQRGNDDGVVLNDDRRTYVVYDGCGGDSGTYLILEDFQRFLVETISDLPVASTSEACVDRSNEIIQRASHFIAAFEAARRPLNIGFTMAMVQVLSSDMVVSAIGDCRVYSSHHGLTLLSHDHTWVAEEVQAGRLLAEDAYAHPLARVTTRALSGLYPTYGPFEHQSFQISPGDRLLLCTDGLWRSVTAEALRRSFAEPSLEVALNTLFNLAASWSDDNITGILLATT